MRPFHFAVHSADGRCHPPRRSQRSLGNFVLVLTLMLAGTMVALPGCYSAVTESATRPAEKVPLIGALSAGPSIGEVGIPSGEILRKISLSPDGSVLAVGTGSLRLWDIAAQRDLHVPLMEVLPSDPIAYSSTGRAFAAVDNRERAIVISQFPEYKEVLRIQPYNPHFLAFSPDAKKLIVCGAELSVLLTPHGTVQLVDLETRKVEWSLVVHEGPVYAASFSPDGTTIAIGTGNRLFQFGIPQPGRLKLIDVRRGKIVEDVEAHPGWVTHVVYSPDGAVLVTGSNDYTINFWDAKTLQKRAGRRVTSVISSMEIIPMTRLVAAGTAPHVQVFSLDDATEVLTSAIPDEAQSFVSFAANGSVVAAKTFDKGEERITIWRLRQGKTN